MFENYLDEIRMSKSEDTFKNYKMVLDWFNKKPIDMTTVKEVMNMSISTNSKKYYLTTWIRALKSSNVECQQIEKFVKGIHWQEKIVSSPQKQDVEAVIRGIREPKFKLAVALQAFAGLRIAEVIDLRVEDIDLQTNRFIIRQTKNHSDRVCFISKKLRPILKSWLENPDRIDGEYLFNSPYGGTYSKVYFQTEIKNWCRKLGHPDFHCHSFRHYFATMVYKKSKRDIHLTARACGHKSINVTMRYIASDLTDIEDAINLI